MATYGRTGDRVRFYEINPAVVALSSGDEPYFTYLQRCDGEVAVVIGDARVALEREQPQGFDVLAIDAFSSDSIPAHLLTVEAVELYFRHLREGGILAVHISNRYLDLDPVVRGIGEKLGLHVEYVEDLENDEVVWQSDWMLLGPARERHEQPASNQRGRAQAQSRGALSAVDRRVQQPAAGAEALSCRHPVSSRAAWQSVGPAIHIAPIRASGTTSRIRMNPHRISHK